MEGGIFHEVHSIGKRHAQFYRAKFLRFRQLRLKDLLMEADMVRITILEKGCITFTEPNFCVFGHCGAF